MLIKRRLSSKSINSVARIQKVRFLRLEGWELAASLKRVTQQGKILEKSRKSETKQAAMAFFNFFKSLIPTVKAQEEELVDPQQELRVSSEAVFQTRFSQDSCDFQEKCATDHHAAHLFERYQECNNRVNSKSKTTETCTEELFDYLHVSPLKLSLF